MVVCVQSLRVCFFFSVEEGGSGRREGGSAVAVVSHERDDAGRGPGQLEEGVLEQLLGRGSLRRLPHQHQVQEGAQHRGHLQDQEEEEENSLSLVQVNASLKLAQIYARQI